MNPSNQPGGINFCPRMSSLIYFGWGREQSESVLKTLIPHEAANIEQLFSANREKFFSETAIIRLIEENLEVLSCMAGVRLRLFRFDSGVYLYSQNYYLSLGPRYSNIVYNRDDIPELQINISTLLESERDWAVLKTTIDHSEMLPDPLIINLISAQD